MTPQEQREYVSEHMDADMQFVVSEAGVSLDNQVAIARYYGNLRKFGALADDRAGVRTACLQDFAIPQDTPPNRSQVAAIVTAWETAKELVAKETEIRAEAKVLGQPRILQTHERQAMMKAVEALYGVIPDSEAPSADYLSQKSEETETNEPNASPLDEVVSRKESTTSSIQSSIDSSGHLRVTRTKCKSKMPSSTEDYRRVMRIEANAWLCMAARYRAKPWLNGLVASDFTKFVDFILGDRVYGIQLPSSTTEFAQKVKPDWSIVLAYEFKLRREVMKLITQQARTMSEALSLVTRDADLKEAFFTTPIALKAAGALEQQPIKYHKGDYKGDFKGPFFKGSGKKGQKGKKGGGKGQIPEALKGLQLVWRTPDNRDFCFAWNAGNKCDDRCSRVHQCRVKGCYGNHKAIEHKDSSKGS